MDSETFAMPEPRWHNCDPCNAAHMPYYTADDLRAAVLEALERAAQECDSRATIEGIAQECASAIRQLADQVKKAS